MYLKGELDDDALKAFTNDAVRYASEKDDTKTKTSYTAESIIICQKWVQKHNWK